jgi:hypothetical protein
MNLNLQTNFATVGRAWEFFSSVRRSFLVGFCRVVFSRREGEMAPLMVSIVGFVVSSYLELIQITGQRGGASEN